eukprot:Plantae.Rhodophyta-Rhodochaete_pulchella.ctg70992.p1 GENE.Plantae.Rhodophyta-Rhodochaete_pulchella.ctg70992~~Plantae.Rhodophyta-Rhodochaete_pulchella.ctg70992.p1  ORF type:complete len:172 (-),score=32.31 Plantae.Rhodophyta-Rhodochaete_pulchella.ctg70992:589-1029(-)
MALANGVEDDTHRLAQRQKQIDYGKNTIGYDEYIRMVPRDGRTRDHPLTPVKEQKCSKRSWDGQVRKWRNMLHAYDPPAPADNRDENEEESHTDNDPSDSDFELDDDGNPIFKKTFTADVADNTPEDARAPTVQITIFDDFEGSPA